MTSVLAKRFGVTVQQIEHCLKKTAEIYSLKREEVLEIVGDVPALPEKKSTKLRAAHLRVLENVTKNRNQIKKYLLRHEHDDIAFFGLWLMDRHPNDCMPVDSDTGKPLILIWSCSRGNRKFVVTATFKERFAHCAEKSRFTFVYLHLSCRAACDKPCEKGHANFLIYDKKLNEIEHVEPWGHQAEFDAPVLRLEVQLLFKGITVKGKKSSITYVPPLDFCPRISFQRLQRAPGGRERGTCFAWSIWYVDFRLSNPGVPRDKLVFRALKWMREKPLRFDDFILRYARDIRKYVFEVSNELAESIFKWWTFDKTLTPNLVLPGELVVLPSKEFRLPEKPSYPDFDTLGQILDITDSHEWYPKDRTFEILLLDGKVITKTVKVENKTMNILSYNAPFLPTRRSMRELVQQELLKRMVRAAG